MSIFDKSIFPESIFPDSIISPTHIFDTDYAMQRHKHLKKQNEKYVEEVKNLQTDVAKLGEEAYIQGLLFGMDKPTKDYNIDEYQYETGRGSASSAIAPSRALEINEKINLQGINDKIKKIFDNKIKNIKQNDPIYNIFIKSKAKQNIKNVKTELNKMKNDVIKNYDKYQKSNFLLGFISAQELGMIGKESKESALQKITNIIVPTPTEQLIGIGPTKHIDEEYVGGQLLDPLESRKERSEEEKEIIKKIHTHKVYKIKDINKYLADSPDPLEELHVTSKKQQIGTEEKNRLSYYGFGRTYKSETLDPAAKKNIIKAAIEQKKVRLPKFGESIPKSKYKRTFSFYLPKFNF